MINTIVGAGAVGAGAASLYGSGSDQMMRLRLRKIGTKSGMWAFNNKRKYKNIVICLTSRETKMTDCTQYCILWLFTFLKKNN
jgi:hypothetical protein